jgi:hypothetical protein
MPADSIYQAQDLHEPHGARTPKKAAIASWIGSALEYYDFFIYGTAAALVFGKIFFSERQSGNRGFVGSGDFRRRVCRAAGWRVCARPYRR